MDVRGGRSEGGQGGRDGRTDGAKDGSKGKTTEEGVK